MAVDAHLGVPDRVVAIFEAQLNSEWICGAHRAGLILTWVMPAGGLAFCGVIFGVRGSHVTPLIALCSLCAHLGR